MSDYFPKDPELKSAKACNISLFVFITNGPPRATGSLSGMPAINKKLVFSLDEVHLKELVLLKTAKLFFETNSPQFNAPSYT